MQIGLKQEVEATTISLQVKLEEVILLTPFHLATIWMESVLCFAIETMTNDENMGVIQASNKFELDVLVLILYSYTSELGKC